MTSWWIWRPLQEAEGKAVGLSLSWPKSSSHTMDWDLWDGVHFFQPPGKLGAHGHGHSQGRSLQFSHGLLVVKRGRSYLRSLIMSHSRDMGSGEAQATTEFSILTHTASPGAAHVGPRGPGTARGREETQAVPLPHHTHSNTHTHNCFLTSPACAEKTQGCKHFLLASSTSSKSP